MAQSDLDNDKFNPYDRYGRHDEKLKNLENMQIKISTDIIEMRSELKEDIKDLIEAISTNTKIQIEALDYRVVRLENIIFWMLFGIVAAAGTLVWTKAVGCL